MEKNMSPPAAVPSKHLISVLEIIMIAFFLIYLMAIPIPFLSLPWFFTAGVAVLLSFMIKEDARGQTVDLFLSCILAFLMFLMFAFHGQAQLFLKQMIIGGSFFRFLLVITSLWLTCRSVPVAVPSKAWKKDHENEDQAMGYLPIFMFVFILHLGFGEDFVPWVFSKAAFLVTVLEELIDFYPALSYISIGMWLFAESIMYWIEHKKGRQIPWAFGGGDVLFLGLFSGYLGLSSLFFLSLIVRVLFSLLQSLLQQKDSFSIN